MPIIKSNSRDRLLAFRLDSSRALKQTDNVVEQLRQQIRQHAFEETQLREQIALLERELAESRWQLARRGS